jgi:hypothetical protein
MARSFAPKQIDQAAVLAQLKRELASASDERLAALTVETLAARYRMDRRQIECTLSAAQDTRRRFLATGKIGA